MKILTSIKLSTWFTIFESNLGADSNTTKVDSMSINVMAIDLLQNSPLLEVPVHSLLSLSSPSLGASISQRHSHAWSTDLVGSSAIASITFPCFTLRNPMDKMVTEDIHIWPSTTGIWSIDPDNVTSLNAKGNFIVHARAFKLVRVSLF